MQSSGNELPDNAATWSIAFIIKTLNIVETCYSNKERNVLGILHGLEKCSSLLFCPWCQSDHRPETAGSNIQERCCSTITQASKNTTMDIPIQHQNTI